MLSFRFRAVGCVAVSMLALSWATAAQAQDAPLDKAAPDAQAANAQEQPVDTRGDIVITAQRRAENLQDVPLSVAVIGGDKLSSLKFNETSDLQYMVPSVTLTNSAGPRNFGFFIRGIGTSTFSSEAIEGSVAYVLDGVVMGQAGASLGDLPDIERIEVLRGPQGTLFGRNTSAGLISIITAKPRFRPEVSGQIDVGNYDMRRIELSATGPISDTVAARLDGVYLRRDGFLKDDISGRDVNDRKRWLLRGQLLFQPTDDLSVRLIGDYSQRREECCAAPYLRAHDTIGSGGSAIEAPSTIATIERGLGAIINDDTFRRHVSITPNRSYNSDVNDGGVSGEIVYDTPPSLTSLL